MMKRINYAKIEIPGLVAGLPAARLCILYDYAERYGKISVKILYEIASFDIFKTAK